MPLFRVYFNRRGVTQPWSVDDGTPETERTCIGVVLNRCAWRTNELEPSQRAAIDAETVPAAWIEVEAHSAVLVGEKIVFVP